MLVLLAFALCAKSRQISIISINALEATARKKLRNGRFKLSKFQAKIFFKLENCCASAENRPIVVPLFYMDKEEFHGMRETERKRRKDPITR